MKQPLPVAVLSALLFLPAFIFGQQGIWTRKADVGGVLRQAAISFSIGNKGYIGAGVYLASSPFQNLNDLWEYDPSTDTWSQMAAIPGPGRIDASAFSIGDKGYVGLGRSLTDQSGFVDFYEYDTLANAWTPTAPFPGGGRYEASSFSAAGKGYICAGSGGGVFAHKDLWEYDPVGDSWALKADLPGPERFYAVGLGIGDKGYVGTGTSSKFVAYKDFYQYDPSNNQWTQKADFAGEGRWFASGFAIGGKAYLGTGINADGLLNFSDFWEYDTTQNKWSQVASMPEVRISAGLSINGKGYVGTGQAGNNNNSFVRVKDFWEFDPAVTLNISSPVQTVFCAGTAHTFDLNYTAIGDFGPGTSFTVQILNSTGLLPGGIDNPIDVGTVAQAGSGTVTVTLSADLPQYGSYRLRLATSTGLAGPKTYQDISIVNAEIALAANISNATCNQPAGFIHLNPSLGDGKYQYLWGDGNTSQNRDHLPVGTYQVTVNDIGCGTITRTYNIVAQSPPAPTINFMKITAPETIVQLGPIEGVANYSVISIPNSTTDTTFLAYPAPSPNITYSLHNLASQTAYTVQAKAYCAAKSDSSEWSYNSFQTPCGTTDFTVPGDSKWNIYAYNGGFGDFEFSWLPADFSGSYVEDGLSFDTRTKWDQYGSPSDATNYQGCSIPQDNFSWRAIRKGFSCGHYSIAIYNHYDEAQLFVNGVMVWDGYSDLSSPPVWEGDLDGESIVEFRTAGGYDASYDVVEFTLLHDIVPQPTITVTAPTTFCTGGSVTLTSSSVAGNQWYLNGSAISEANGQSYIATATGTYTVAVTTGSCTSTISENKIVTVNPAPPKPTITSGGPVSFCTGGSVTLTSSATSGNQWYVNGAAIGNAGSQTYTATAAGVYTVITTTGGCASESSAGTTVTVNQKPNAIATPSSQSICSGTASSIALTSNIAGTSFSWTVMQTGVTGAAPGNGNSIVQTLTATGNAPGKAIYTITPVNGCTGTPITATVTVTQAPTITVTAGTINCNGGLTTITVNASGSAGSYKYKLSGGVSFQVLNKFIVGAGTYTVTVQSGNGCTKTTGPVIISQPPAISINSSAAPINCYGGTTTLTVTAGGGTSPYTYALDNGSYKNNNLFTVGAGTHTISVKDLKGCVSSKPVTINQPSAVSVNISATSISCSGGTSSITVSATGGTSPYTGTGTFTKSAGMFTFKVADSRGCAGSKTITITQPLVLSVSVNSKTNVSCFGGNNGSISVKANGGTSPYTFKINSLSFQNSNTFSNLMAGSYSVTLKDKNGCTAIISGIIITQPSVALILTLVQKTDVSCLNGSNGSLKVSASGGTPPYKYSLNNGSFGTSGTFSSLRAGTYTVNAKDVNNCTKSITVTVNNGTGKCNNTLSLGDPAIANPAINAETWLKASVTPNPAETDFTLTLSGNNNKPVEIRVIDMYGKNVHHTRGSANQSYKFGQQFTSGVYIVEILQDKVEKNLKIIKAR